MHRLVWPPGHIIGYEHTFVHTVYDLLEGIADGSSPQPSFDDGVKNQRVLDAWERSAGSRRWEKVWSGFSSPPGWIDLSELGESSRRARRRRRMIGKKGRPRDYATVETVRLKPWPRWARDPPCGGGPEGAGKQATAPHRREKT